jgi:membrane-bound metal-dependent hydrolase YbcI (DUF457 family)
VPDLIWITRMHRLYTTSVFFMAGVLGILYIIFTKFFPSQKKTLLIISAFMLFSHIFLDFEAIVGLFYPVYPKYFYTTSQITIENPSLEITPTFKIFVTEPSELPARYTSYLLATSTSLVIFFVLFVLIYHLVFDKERIKKLIK